MNNLDGIPGTERLVVLFGAFAKRLIDEARQKLDPDRYPLPKDYGEEARVRIEGARMFVQFVHLAGLHGLETQLDRVTAEALKALAPPGRPRDDEPTMKES